MKVTPVFSRAPNAFSITCPAGYRIDSCGNRVVLLPTRCTRGAHALATSGYTAVVAADGVLRVGCSACAASDVDSWWLLITSGQAALAAEFSFAAYRVSPVSR